MGVLTTRNLARRDPKLLITRRASFLLQQTCEHPAISNLEGSAVAASPPAIIISWGESFFSSGTSSTAAARWSVTVQDKHTTSGVKRLAKPRTSSADLLSPTKLAA